MKNLNIRISFIISGAIILIAILVILIKLNITFRYAPIGMAPEKLGNNYLDSSASSSSVAVDQNKDIKDGDKKIIAPINDALNRITKKSFGIHITPQTSPVSPEKFSGYHTGVDFETRENEQDIDIDIFAICNGPLLVKRNVSGYGGVAIQSCEIDKGPVTVIYGHLNLASITKDVKGILFLGDKIGVLGKAYSLETSGERKHLHLGISRGTDINYTGYVKSESELKKWLDPLPYIKLILR